MKKSKVIKKNHYHTVIDDGKYIIKQYDRFPEQMRNPEWQLRYQGLYERFPNITPELIDIELPPSSKPRIVIEKVEGLTVENALWKQVEIHKQSMPSAIKKGMLMNNIINTAFCEYSLELPDLQYAWHRDVSIKNVIVQDFDNLDFKFIDIDSIYFDFIFMRQNTLEAWLIDLYAEHRVREQTKQNALHILNELLVI